jgi:hypothetical protein
MGRRQRQYHQASDDVPHRDLFILDACVLIDYLDADASVSACES